MGYTSTMLLISVSYIGYQTMCIPVAKKVPRYGQWDKSIAKELPYSGHRPAFIQKSRILNCLRSAAVFYLHAAKTGVNKCQFLDQGTVGGAWMLVDSLWLALGVLLMQGAVVTGLGSWN